MKKILLSFISLTLVAFANGQITLTSQAHSYLVGDKHDFYLAQKVDEGKSGANVTWDFSALAPLGKSLTSYMLNPALSEKGLLVASANIALQEFDNVFYFRTTNTAIEQYGSSSGNSLTTFSKPFVKIKYPFTYNDVVKGDYAGVQVTGNNTTDLKGTYLIEGDAWGTLILPNGIYNNTLRVKQLRTYKYNNGAEAKEITYRWYSASVRYPLLVIIKYENNGHEAVSQVAYFAHYTNDNFKSAPIVDLEGAEIGVSPNPFNNTIEVSYSVPGNMQVTIDLLDSKGNLAASILAPSIKEAGKYSISYSVSGSLTAGYHYVKATFGNQTIVKKIVKL